MKNPYACFALFYLLFSAPAAAETYYVQNPADSGAYTLRDAIRAANDRPGPDVIEFGFVGPGPHVITLLSQLPDITDHGLVIDGTQQAGYLAGQPQVVISGLGLSTNIISDYRPAGLIVRGANCTIQGLCLHGFAPQPGQAIAASPSDGSTAIRLHGLGGLVRHCIFGLSPDGMSVFYQGVKVNNLVDFLIVGDSNVVENCVGDHISCTGNDNIIRNNIIGFRRDGTKFATAAEEDLILALIGCRGNRNRIGQRGNGNRSRFIRVSHASENSFATDISIQGNTLGIDSSGHVVGGSLCLLRGSRRMLVGGEDVGAGNTIYVSNRTECLSEFSAIGPTGIYFSEYSYGGAAGHFDYAVIGNDVHTADAGCFFDGRGFNGIGRISGNRLHSCNLGIGLESGNATLSANLFPNTRQFSISLRYRHSRSTGNDPLDLDTGANGFQNHPVLTSAIHNPALNRTEVTGQISSTPNHSYRIELYTTAYVAGREPTGEVSHGTVDVVANTAGVGVFQFSLPGVLPNQVFSALATDLTAGGLTSIMSPGLRPAPGTLRILPAVASVSEAGVSSSLRIVRSGGTFGAVSVRLAADGLTTASADLRFLYNGITAVPPVVNFASGETEQIVDVFAFDDLLDEAAEVTTLTLTAPTGGSSVGESSTLVIATDNDAPPSFSVNDIAVNEDVGVATFTVTLSAPSGLETRVVSQIYNGTAFSPSDYSAVTLVDLIFAPGQTIQNVNLSIANTPGPEITEEFYVHLFGAFNATISDDAGVCTITDVDGVPTSTTAFRFFTPSYATPEGGFLGQTFITVERTGSLVGPAQVLVSTALSDASTGDVNALNGQVVAFADGEQFKVLTLTLLDDALDEDDERLVLYLHDPTGPGGAVLDGLLYELIITLQDDDAPPVITAGTLTKSEGDDGIVAVDLPFTLSAASGRWFRLDFGLEGGAATPGVDFYTVTTSVWVGPGELSGSIPLRIVGDHLAEPDEEVKYTLTNTLGHVPIEGKLIIQNDDPVVPTFRLEGLPGPLTENSGTFNLTLRRRGDVAGNDVCLLSLPGTSSTLGLGGTMYAFAPGEETKTVEVTIKDDVRDEPDETLAITLQPSPGTLAEAPGFSSVTILDDDAPPTVSLRGPFSILELDLSSTPALVSVSISLSAPSGYDVQVADFLTSSGSATSEVDFTPLIFSSLTIPAGETELTLLVAVAGDFLDEADETFSISISSATGATLGTASQEITIIDNDTPQRPYRNWLAGHFSLTERRTGLTNPCADPDGDKLSNGLEFFLDTNPRNAASGAEQLGLTSTATSLSYSVTGLTSRASFVRPQLTVSKTLTDWAEATAYGYGYAVDDLPSDVRVYKIAPQFSATSSLFIRLETDCPVFVPEP